MKNLWTYGKKLEKSMGIAVEYVHCKVRIESNFRKYAEMEKQRWKESARRSQRREMKNCMPFWREAHFQVKSVKNPGSQTTFGS